MGGVLDARSIRWEEYRVTDCFMRRRGRVGGFGFVWASIDIWEVVALPSIVFI